ncbi:hypothetical protein LQZ19_08670 [Treponema primitia]|uniref:hypothetical protein n=1 Tax=Treponema primitia TaxID=88058 RepID=UPI00397EC230
MVSQEQTVILSRENYEALKANTEQLRRLYENQSSTLSSLRMSYTDVMTQLKHSGELVETLNFQLAALSFQAKQSADTSMTLAEQLQTSTASLSSTNASLRKQIAETVRLEKRTTRYKYLAIGAVTIGIAGLVAGIVYGLLK